MGMYTELVCAFELENDTPIEVINTIRYMTGQLDKIEKTPNHELFDTDRWSFMLRSDSYYFEGDTHSAIRLDDLYKGNQSHLNSYYVTIRCNLKNYNGEIEKFINWIKLYSTTKGFIGYKRYKEYEEPTLIFI